MSFKFDVLIGGTIVFLLEGVYATFLADFMGDLSFKFDVLSGGTMVFFIYFFSSYFTNDLSIGFFGSTTVLLKPPILDLAAVLALDLSVYAPFPKPFLEANFDLSGVYYTFLVIGVFLDDLSGVSSNLFVLFPRSVLENLSSS